MQKKLKLMLAVASLFIATGLVFIACGEGTEMPLTDELIIDVKDAADMLMLADNMSSIVDEALQSRPSSNSEEPNPPPSSGGNPTQSSGGQPGSSQGPNGSSSSPAPAGSSSSVTQRSSSSVAPTVKGCGEDNPKSGYTCSWNETGSNIVPGTVLKPKDPNPPSGCSAVTWKYADGTSAMILQNGCREVPANGVEALGSKTYVLFAELTCGTEKQTTACEPKSGLPSKGAPLLEGDCKWDKNPTSTARGAVPSGITAKDTNKVSVCSGTPDVEYRYDDGSKLWPTSGKLDEWASWGKEDSKTYNVAAYIKCGGYPGEVKKACDPLVVNGGVEHVIECNCGTEQCQLSDKTCKADGAAGNKVTLQKDECVDVNVYGYNNEYVLVDVGMRCDSQTESTITYAGKSKTFQYNSDLLILGTLKLGTNEFGTVCVTKGGPVTCSGPGN